MVDKKQQHSRRGRDPKIAAGISYTFRPTDDDAIDVDDEVSGNPRYLSIEAIDGVEIAAVLWQPAGAIPARTTIVIMVHGSGANYRSPPQSALGPQLMAKGYAALAIDTRQHDAHINTDNFFDIRRDIDAAVHTVRALGYRAIVLQGHSLGNIQVQFYAATNWDRDIKAVVLLGAFGNLPWKTRTILVQDETKFKNLIHASLASLAERTIESVLPVPMHYYTGADVPVTAQHFLTYRWDKSSVADGTFWIRRIPLPILLVRDAADAVVHPFEPHILLEAAHAEGSLVTSIKYISLANDKPPSLDAHVFLGNEQPLAEALTGWLAECGL